MRYSVAIRIVQLAVAGVLVAGGGLTVYQAMLWSVESTYLVQIQAPDDVSWITWAPRPAAAMDLFSITVGLRVTEISTARGVMLNVSGTGPGGVVFMLRQSYVGESPLGRPFAVGIEGRETNGTYWAYRATGGLPVWMVVAGDSRWKGVRLGDSIHCGGPGYSGAMTEGWNLLPERFADCSVFLSTLDPRLLSLPFFAGGAAMVAYARRMWRRGPPI